MTREGCGVSGKRGLFNEASMKGRHVIAKGGGNNIRGFSGDHFTWGEPPGKEGKELEITGKKSCPLVKRLNSEG